MASDIVLWNAAYLQAVRKHPAPGVAMASLPRRASMDLPFGKIYLAFRPSSLDGVVGDERSGACPDRRVERKCLGQKTGREETGQIHVAG